MASLPQSFAAARMLQRRPLIALGGDGVGDRREVRAPHVLGQWREDVVPDRGEAAEKLRHPRRPCHEPPVQVLAPVAPATDMHTPDLADCTDCALDPCEEHAELGRELVRQIAGLREMLARLEQDNDRQACWRVERPQAPALARPEVLVVGADAAHAFDTAMAVPGRLLLDGRLEAARPHLAVERERLPVLDGRHSERSGRACVQLLGSLRQGPGMLPSAAVEWPQSFYELRRGEGCGMCADGRPDELPWGTRIFVGSVSDAYLQRRDIQHGYTIVIWRGRHVVEPTELAAEEAAAYWLEGLHVGRALEAHLRPVKMNYDLLGNSLPHLHAHVLPRYADDPRPGWPLPFPETEPPPLEETVFNEDVQALRSLLATPPRS